jgi:sterol 3beta-glucosyltransferase
MKIALLTLGTRGDVQPYAVLGHALRQRGHRVVLATAQNFKELVESYGLEFVPVEADYAALLKTEEGKKIMGVNPFAIGRNLEKWIFPLVRSSLRVFYDVAASSDLVLFHAKTMAESFADAFPEKMVRAMVLPALEPTSEFPNPALSGLPLPKWLWRRSYGLMELGLRMFRKPVREFRVEKGLPPAVPRLNLPALYGLSEQVLAKPQDWTSDACFSGFWVDPESAPDLDREVVDFLEAGTSPLVITFGSMPVSLRFDLESSLYRALDALPDLRLVVVRGWGLEGLKSTADGRLLVVDQVPYDRLFPRALAVIHHGGVGTTAACLLSGTPFWICPVLYPIGDQWFWGKRAEALGVALPPVPLKKLSEKGFLKGVAALVGASPQEAMDAARRKECARAFQSQLSQEKGLLAAVEWVEGR